jgi:phytoene synthase
MHPSSPDAPPSRTSDYAVCREAIRHGSRTFFAASLVLPASVRDPAYGLYAFCRLSDDAVDLGDGSPRALDRLRERLDRIYDGRPIAVAADRAMADIVRRYAIPRAVPEALLEGLAWDLEDRRYEDIGDLFDYAARVAGTVGVMMTLLMGVRSREALARACDLGVAMQLTNIARDVGEDARNGRLYLPLRWLRDEGIEPDAVIANPASSAPLARVTARLLSEADALYARARSGVAHLPLSCRPAILAAGLIYAEIGRVLESMSCDSINHRARVSGFRKSRLLARAVAMTPWLEKNRSPVTIPAVQFLVDEVMKTPSPQASDAWPTVRSSIAFAPRLLRVLEIFERLERAEQFGK